ncbi:unnamed protein product [Sphagnum jensenii]|uniref:DYW domain-containing protein n=1 Tax=Sphagnum jensenii TaxID=128206 RepID=A0ABP1A6L7_9BRYO
MEVSVAFAVLMIIYGWDVKNTWLISLIWISGWYPDFKHKKIIQSGFALEEGKHAHEQIIESGWDSDIFVWEWLGGQHAKCGSMEDSWKVFNKMPSPDMATWNAICRERAIHGHGKEALNPFDQMYEEGVQPDYITFVCLLSACSHEEHVAKWILELEPENAGGYVLLSNIYAAGEIILGLMHHVGYMAYTKLVLQDVEEEEKVFHFCQHSKKLLVALGLINTAPGTPLQIRKNMQVCEDCHTSTKLISKIVGTTIVVRDATHSYHFEDGICLCMDYR